MTRHTTRGVILTIHGVLLHLLAGTEPVLLVLTRALLLRVRAGSGQYGHRDPPRLGSLSRLTVAGTPAGRTSRGTSASRPWRQSSACCTSLSFPSQSAWPRPPSASPGTVSSRVHCC